ncbi:hypothetical protein HHK36_022032 [Tetracentron sinense]|uniref:Pentatricopeptide repeat-containing protein n=1 Tax=Tetracentron sinense TaxID=13715 RepID=A0A835D608_TETSI|nr:hypothetical protein HHK36_022032 [Tetracentron sinense]
MACVSINIDELLSQFGICIVEHASYILKLGSNIRSLRDKMKALKCRKDNVKSRVNLATLQRMTPRSKVKLWIETVETTERKVNDIVNEAYSQTGLVDKGTEYLYSMDREHGIMTMAQHHTCMIDLLGHAGRIEDAQVLMSNLPFELDAATWGDLLGASRIHGDTKLSEEAAELIIEMSIEKLAVAFGILIVPSGETDMGDQESTGV